MARFIAFTFFLLMSFESITAQEPVIGGPCQGCELVFVDMPDQLKTNSRIGEIGETGEPLVLSGTVYNPDRTPVGSIIVYAYQTDANGKYPKGSTQHGKLRGWAVTGQKGHYQFKTIRPQAYPGRDIPQHIQIKEPIILMMSLLAMTLCLHLNIGRKKSVAAAAGVATQSATNTAFGMFVATLF
jgi:hypothetical protein